MERRLCHLFIKLFFYFRHSPSCQLLKKIVIEKRIFFYSLGIDSHFLYTWIWIINSKNRECVFGKVFVWINLRFKTCYLTWLAINVKHQIMNHCKEMTSRRKEMKGRPKSTWRWNTGLMQSQLSKPKAEGRGRNSGRVATVPYVPAVTERIGEVTVWNRFVSCWLFDFDCPYVSHF